MLLRKINVFIYLGFITFADTLIQSFFLSRSYSDSLKLIISFLCSKTSCGSPFSDSKRQSPDLSIQGPADLDPATCLPSPPMLCFSSHSGLFAVPSIGEGCLFLGIFLLAIFQAATFFPMVCTSDSLSCFSYLFKY